MDCLSRLTWLLHLALFVGSATAGPAPTLETVEELLDFDDVPATCQPLPPTPNPGGPGEALTSCLRTRDDAQINTMRTAKDRLVWLSYAGPWQRLDPGQARWDALRADLERELGAPTRIRGSSCVLWQRDDAVVRASLLGSPISDDPAVGLLRIVIDAADTPGAVDC